MGGEPDDLKRRNLLARLASGTGSLACMGGVVNNFPSAMAATAGEPPSGWHDVRRDFNARGDGVADDTRALQDAIDAGCATVRPVNLGPGVYKITRPLTIASNAMLVGSSPSLGFGCRIEPQGCAAFVVGGKSPSFHCSIENLMIWPKGAAPEYLMLIDNSYSVTFRNIRIHEAQTALKRAAVLLLGNSAAGGHGPCTNIIWDNLIVRNDSGQPPVAVFASAGCGSHRFITPDWENYRVLLEWQGGQLDIVAPYTERAGRYAVNCNLDGDDKSAYLNTFGGVFDSANSGLGCAIRSTTRDFNSFGTLWGGTAEHAAYVYSLPSAPITFHGIVPNFAKAGRARFSGIPGWRKFVNFPQHSFKTSRSMKLAIPAGGRQTFVLSVPGIVAGEYWVRVMVNTDSLGVQIRGFASDDDIVTIVAENFTDTALRVDGIFTVDAGVA